jgi:uncharacterized membrane protein YqiK
MIELILGFLFLLGGAAVLFGALTLKFPGRALWALGGLIACCIGFIMIIVPTAVDISDTQTGVISKTVGADLPQNHVVAVNGEKGPQAQILGPGWHFGYWPWKYEITKVDTIVVPAGSLGVVTALDGKPLPTDEVYAPPWKDQDQMLDASAFLKGDGYRGPQLTVLTPGRYRYNPNLFTIEPKPGLIVNAGEVAVVKANSGQTFTGQAQEVNGTALVPKGFRGIWKEPLEPGAYYLHPDAYHTVTVVTTNRVYTYQDKARAIKVRSKDGFTFPVDVRVSVNVSAEDAPYLVALLGNPDQIVADEQEHANFSVLEIKVILPAVRAIFRNVAQEQSALDFVNNRTQVEAAATEHVRKELERFKITTEGVFVGNIDLDETDAGKALLATQTDKQVALNREQLYAQQQKAENARAELVKSQTQADQQKQLAEAEYGVKVKQQQALAREQEALGEAKYIEITAEARQKAYQAMAQALGQQGVTQLELMKMISDGKVQITPQVMVTGGAGMQDALAGTILSGAAKAQEAPAKH